MKRIFALVVLITGLASCSSSNDSFNTCTVSNCHGLEVECGFVEMMACTQEYQIGDRCRGYVQCQVSDGECLPVAEDEYNNCVQCVNACIDRYGQAQGILECESEC